ncbi:MAG: hypothetical protein ARM1_0097 [Candidatus Micrarchaeota archaeon]|nr:MAG: hypothetical protein ARM1_0097 [Candidatus Micrarchaeota archaeon]
MNNGELSQKLPENYPYGQYANTGNDKQKRPRSDIKVISILVIVIVAVIGLSVLLKSSHKTIYTSISTSTIYQNTSKSSAKIENISIAPRLLRAIPLVKDNSSASYYIHIEQLNRSKNYSLLSLINLTVYSINNSVVESITPIYYEKQSDNKVTLLQPLYNSLLIEYYDNHSYVCNADSILNITQKTICISELSKNSSLYIINDLISRAKNITIYNISNLAELNASITAKYKYYISNYNITANRCTYRYLVSSKNTSIFICIGKDGLISKSIALYNYSNETYSIDIENSSKLFEYNTSFIDLLTHLESYIKDKASTEINASISLDLFNIDGISYINISDIFNRTSVSSKNSSSTEYAECLFNSTNFKCYNIHMHTNGLLNFTIRQTTGSSVALKEISCNEYNYTDSIYSYPNIITLSNNVSYNITIPCYDNYAPITVLQNGSYFIGRLYIGYTYPNNTYGSVLASIITKVG